MAESSGPVSPPERPKAWPAEVALWLLGGMAAWSAFWLLIGAGPIVQLYHHPHPWLISDFTPPVFIYAWLEWMRSALAVYASAGLISLAAALPARRRCGGGRPFRRALALGLATALWVHGLLYLQVPTALSSLAGLGYLPIGLLILGFLAGGAALGWRGLAPLPARGRAGLLVPLLAAFTLLPYVPHDLLRRGDAAAPLARTEPRLMLVSFDALRRDTLERDMPAWKRSAQVQTITVFPATRLAWETILGADPDRTFRTTMAPPLWEALHPEHLRLLVQARAAKVRTAFAINDSLSPCYGLQPTLFDTVQEPEGGWKYWLSYGEGTTWPLYSWLENLRSPIETSNPWNDTSAWFRDLGRLLPGHHWVSSHNCLLHPPIRLTLDELQSFDPWRWLLHSPEAYVSYEGFSDQEGDFRHWRETWRSDGKRQYEVRAARMLKAVVPFLEEWGREYPGLSGVLMADHGEGFPVYLQNGTTPVTHGSGLHGFGLDALTVGIPLHPFGATLDRLADGQVWSILDLRDAIGAWIGDRKPLILEGNPKGWLVQIETIVATHLARPEPGAPANHARGILPMEIASHIQLLVSGNWFQKDMITPGSGTDPVSSALVTGNGMVLVNPVDVDQFYRQEIRAGQVLPGRIISLAEYRKEVREFPGRRAVPSAMP